MMGARVGVVPARFGEFHMSQVYQSAAPRNIQPDLWDLIQATRATGTIVGIHRGRNGQVESLSFANVPDVAPGCWGLFTAREIMRNVIAKADA